MAISCIAAVLAILGAVGCAVAIPRKQKEKADKITILSLFFIVSLLGGILHFYFVRLAENENLLLGLQSVVIAAKACFLAFLVLCIADVTDSKDAVSRIGAIITIVLAVAISVLLFVNCFTPYLFAVEEGGEPNKRRHGFAYDGVCNPQHRRYPPQIVMSAFWGVIHMSICTIWVQT